MSLEVIPNTVSTRLYDFISRRWLPVGYLVLLTGLFWVAERSQFSKSFYALLALPALLGLLIRPRILASLLREPIVLCYLLFAAWLLLSLIWTASDDSASSLAKRPLYVFMLFAACAIMATRDEHLLPRFLRASAAIAALAAAINVLLFLLGAPAAGRMVGTGGLINPLLTSHVLGFFCAYWLAAWATRTETHVWLPPLAALPLLLALLATGSRTPLAALLACCLWLALLAANRRSLYLLAALPLAGAGLYVFAPELLVDRGLSHRPELWSAALAQVPEHLWLGYGYDSAFTFKINTLPYPLSDPHNIELAVLLELGVVGLCLWLLLYGLTLGRCLQLRQTPMIQLTSTLVIYGLAAGMTEGSSFLSRPNENWFLVWLPLSLAAALSIHQRQRRQP